MRFLTSSKRPVLPHRHEQGVVLVVVLIMLVVIGLVSAAAMRGAMSADMISNNARIENLAKQAAQIGLRYCEEEIVKDTPAITIYAAPTSGSAAWTTFSNWFGTTGVKATTVPASYMQSTDSAFTPATRPQCLAEYSAVNANIVIITARGFSPDFSAATDGSTATGSVVWFQSFVSLQSI
ncbi:PilX N-terminal domain-containing pilus assembly protein [Aquabacterium sp.]|uniref:PilX N-terminal domain-containing pilus assembly protein n=1 Tax=Aquabacterium sp. TaxID=1872578 RepID=UPI0035B292C8